MNATNWIWWAVSTGGKGHGRSIKHQVISKKRSRHASNEDGPLLDTRSFSVFWMMRHISTT